MLTVEKIGGTSMTQFDKVIDNIIKKSGPHLDSNHQRVFVVSAYSGVTDWLLEHKKTGEPGVYSLFALEKNYSVALDELLEKLLQLNQQYESLGLNLLEAESFLRGRIEQAKTLLSSLSQVLASGYVNKSDIQLAAREILASIGEAHSAWNSVNILQRQGIKAKFIDLSGWNDNEPLTIDERIRKEFLGIDLKESIAIATGYTKGIEGIMRAFDRGYSEVTFSKIAVDLKVDEAIIHKEYHLSSADPNIVGIENCTPVGKTNYIVADQLADIGMEAIHPKASKPLELAGINIRIKNTFEPDHKGTVISRDYKSPEAKIELVSGSTQMLAIEIHDPLMVNEVGYDARIMSYFQKHGVSYVFKSTNANSITMVVWDNEKAHKLVEELKENFYRVSDQRVALVCAIGSNIQGPGFLYRAAKAFYENGINIECYGQSLMQVNLQFVILREHYKEAIRALNKALC